MNTTQSNSQLDAPRPAEIVLNETGSHYGRRNPLEIGVQLRNPVNDYAAGNEAALAGASVGRRRGRAAVPPCREVCGEIAGRKR